MNLEEHLNKLKKRHFFNNKDYILDMNEQVVKLTPEFHTKLLNKKLWGKFGFKKIGGSSIGDVLLVDQWKSQFVAFCRIAWIGIPVLDRKYVDAGINIEPKVIQAIEETTKKTVETFPPEKYNFDYFADKHEIVGGLPDGLIKEDGIVLEIKTTGEKNLQKWKQWGIPKGYLKQAALYTYLMNLRKFSIVATFLKEEDYLDSNNYPIKQRQLKNYNFELDENEVKDDIDKVVNWYTTFTKSGISPAFDITKDKDQIDYLKCSTQEEWEALISKWQEEGKVPTNE